MTTSVNVIELLEELNNLAKDRKVNSLEEMPEYFKEKFLEHLPKIIEKCDPDEIWLTGSLTDGTWSDGTEDRVHELRKLIKLKRKPASDIDLVLIPRCNYREEDIEALLCPLKTRTHKTLLWKKSNNGSNGLEIEKPQS